jgi:hypothetical protein
MFNLKHQTRDFYLKIVIFHPTQLDAKIFLEMKTTFQLGEKNICVERKKLSTGREKHVEMFSNNFRWG